MNDFYMYRVQFEIIDEVESGNGGEYETSVPNIGKFESEKMLQEKIERSFGKIKGLKVLFINKYENF